MTFEWDNQKNEYNKKNHDGISFEFAVRVFLDEKRIEKYDWIHSTDPHHRSFLFHTHFIFNKTVRRHKRIKRK